MVLKRDICRESGHRIIDALQDLPAELGMIAHNLPFPLIKQRRLAQYRFGNPQLSNVVKTAA